MRIIVASISLFVMAMIVGCGKSQIEDRPTSRHVEPVEIIGDISFHQLYVDGFEDLPLNLKRYAYHLWHAAILSRDITFDQLAPRSLEIRKIIDDLMLARKDSTTKFDRHLRQYAVRFWVGYGNYDAWTGRKFVPEFTLEELAQKLTAIGYTQEQLAAIRELEAFIFDAGFRSVLVDHDPADGDPVYASSVNLYDAEVTMKLAQQHDPGYYIFGRWAYAGGELVEEVYRTGAPDVTPGRLAARVERVVSELETARTFAPKESKGKLGFLIQSLRTGDPSPWRQYYDRRHDLGNPVEFELTASRLFDPLYRRDKMKAVMGFVLVVGENIGRLETTELINRFYSGDYYREEAGDAMLLGVFGSEWFKLLYDPPKVNNETDQLDSLNNAENVPESIHPIAFIFPELVPVRNRMGGFRDIRLEYPGDFVGQMLRFDLME